MISGELSCPVAGLIRNLGLTITDGADVCKIIINTHKHNSRPLFDL